MSLPDAPWPGGPPQDGPPGPPTAAPVVPGDQGHGPRYGAQSAHYGQPYGAPGAYGPRYGSPLRVPGGLALSTIALSSVVTAIQVLVWVTSFGAAAEVRGAVDGYTGGFAAANAYNALNVLLIVAQAAAGIVACIWLWQSRVFAETVTPGAPHERSRVWVWLGWFVPVVAWWFPFQVVRDVGRATQRREPSRLGLWWTGWLVFGVVSNAVARVLDASTIDALPALETIATAGLVLALVGWVQIIRDLTRAQRTYVG